MLTVQHASGIMLIGLSGDDDSSSFIPFTGLLVGSAIEHNCYQVTQQINVLHSECAILEF